MAGSESRCAGMGVARGRCNAGWLGACSFACLENYFYLHYSIISI